jgi:2,3-bisphosphoglycerate-dependent phosphoglycerate mutase
VKSREAKPTLWFVRHGESTWNAARLVQGQAGGSVLTAKGRWEAARAAARLGDIGVAAIYSSDLDRGRETAAIIAGVLRLPLRLDPALRERSFGDAEGHPLRELRAAASGIEGDRVVDAGARPPAGESLGELYERVQAFITALEARGPDGDVLVVTHGGVIRVAEAYCNGVAVDDMAWGLVANASVWGLSRPDPSVVVVQ